ncbi:MAG: hypothetical protein LBG10_07745 [Treponema sp.]|jgi:hypothetical protein|nr:hypothetical protein [Treponema sp.]
MRGNNLPGAAMIMAALVLSLVWGGCDLLSNKPEIDVEKAIDNAVWIANAPVLNVEVDEGGMGTASPRGILSGIKQGVPFQLNYQVNSSYPYYGWQARLEGSGGGSPYILPFNDPGRSFKPQGIFDTGFKNITIRGSVNQPFGYSGFYLENFFYPPLLSADGKTLTLWTRSLRDGTNNGKPAFQALVYSGGGWWDSAHLTITVSVDGAIQDESGLAMGISKSFSYQVTKNNGESGPPDISAYTSTLSYGTGNIFPNTVYGNACMILEEKTGETVINDGDMINVVSPNPLEVPADGEARWVYVLFQSYPWPLARCGGGDC